MDNDWKKRLGVVYSTNELFEYEGDGDAQQETLPPSKQKLYISLDRKNRKGKAVTLVEGFTGNAEDLKNLGKELKSKCGSGGTAKDGEIIIQGDFRDRVETMLKDKGYQIKRKGG
jgi:translation initiation factor 1